MEENDDGALSNFMKKQQTFRSSEDKKSKSDSLGVFLKNKKEKKGTDLGEGEKKELEEAKKESKALATRMASIEPELMAIRFKKMLVFYSIIGVVVLLCVYAHMRNPTWFSTFISKVWSSIFF